MATAQNGWAASSNRVAINVDSNFNVNGVTFPGGVKAGDVSTVLHYVADQFHKRVETLRPGWCWGYNYRSISGGVGLSNHSAACAIDVNAPAHPQGKRNTFSAAQVSQIQRIVAECHGVVRWGGTYRSAAVDEMHFEIVGNLAQVVDVAAKLRGVTAAAPSTAATILRRGSKGSKVENLQRVLNAWYPFLGLAVDGDYGPSTEAGVRDLQRRAGITVDGIAGPQTLGVLGIR